MVVGLAFRVRPLDLTKVPLPSCAMPLNSARLPVPMMVSPKAISSVLAARRRQIAPVASCR